ncbi:MAG: PLD nuclease N-terminal domain-containing protein [bacterium]|nr:PLD nuclease N-terminal domain-containing protein [bacterium]
MSLLNLAFYILWLVLFVWALLDIIGANKSMGWKVIWGLVCLAFPVAGTILYYLVARQKDMHLPQDFQK